MEFENKPTANGSTVNGELDNGKAAKSDRHKWVASLEYILESILKNEEPEQARCLVEELSDRLRQSGLKIPLSVSTPYINTIPPEKEPPYPGNREIERRIKSYVRWNAMAMVVKANRLHADIGGHISTYASSATLYEVGHNHFFRGSDGTNLGDMVYFQGHASPGVYSRAYLEWRINAPKLHHFRQELASVGGLSSYPHPYLMPDFWQFPTVSMGLAPIMSIYQARFIRYLQSRGLISGEEPRDLVFRRRRRNGRTGIFRRAHAGVAGKSRQSYLGRQLQSAAPRRPGARQRQNHSGTRSAVSRRRLERHQSHLGLRLGSAARQGRQRACCSSAWKKRWTAIIRSIRSSRAATRASISSANIPNCWRWSTT